MKTQEFKPPIRPVISQETKKHVSMFLAGSIEMGAAEPWQEQVVKAFPFNVNIFNPKRDEWDSSWEQDINNPMFYEQVSWELDMLDKADIIPMYFDPTTKSPITLMELGLHAQNTDWTGLPKLIVCCPKGFWRKGNVNILCQRYGIPCFNNKETWMIALKNRIDLIKTRV
jgi:hypothetical protein